MTKLSNDPVVRGMIASMQDPVINILVCLDGGALENQTLRQGQPDGMDRMLASFLGKLRKTANVRQFSFAASQTVGAEQLGWAHIFWQAGSGGGDTSRLVQATMQSRPLWKLLQDRVSLNEMAYVGVCVGRSYDRRCSILWLEAAAAS